MAARSKPVQRPAAAPGCGSTSPGTAAVGSIEAMPLEITRGSVDDIDSLEPLWVAVHHAHQAAMPELAPYVDDEETWREHRPLYVELFERPDTFLFLARVDGELIGYALGCVAPASEGFAADTWRVGDRIGELESLSVLPEHRGEGIGSQLLDKVDEAFDKLGIDDVVIGALPGNTGALKLYESRGFKPTWIYLSRFAARGDR
jgi:ribosomal protein S18 acetylase RimI-like enzyme